MIFIISINTLVSAKYVISYEINIANVNLDNTKPVLEVINIKNTNIGYEKYANKTHTITIETKIIEKNIKTIKFDEEHIDIYLDNKKMKADIQVKEENGIYKICLSNIKENGKLKVVFKEGIVEDIANLINEEKMIDTQIIIDNEAPVGKFTENNIGDGKSIGKIELNEVVRKLEGWTLNGLTLEKEFTNNISYEIPVLDYAGNKSIVDVNITKATYINVIYASHNSMIGWSFGYGNYDVAGKQAVLTNPIYKTEGLAFNVNGNIDLDFIRARAYVYTYWGEGSKGLCNDEVSTLEYSYGYNPSQTGYKSMMSDKLAMIGGKRYFQFAGSGLNGNNQTDANGQNPIPDEIASQFNYGISGINLMLKDYSYYSIVYQIYVNEVGWIKVCSDGEECVYNHKKPMSAFRMALIPKTEKQYLIDMWNKDIGTNNMN